MLIYIFTDYYPSNVKPYFDTQFEQFVKDGHQIRIFANSSQGDELEDKVRVLGLDKMTSHTPSTIKTILPFWGAISGALIKNPFQRISGIFRIITKTASIKQNFLYCMRAMMLPLEKPDLCLVHNLRSAVQFPFLRNIYQTVPVAFYYHGGEVAGVATINNVEAKRAFHSADNVFTNTESSKEHAIGRGCDVDKITVCPVGFNLSEFVADENREYKKDGILHLLTIGRMSKEKGHIYALKAMAGLLGEGATNFQYNIIGGGPLRDELKAFVDKNGLTNHVHFLGHVTRERLYQEIKSSDVHILPSIIVGTWQENQACVVQEAMLFQTLVIVSTAGGVPESTAPIMHQFNVEPENPKMIMKSLKKLLATSQEDMQQMGKECRRFSNAHYNIEALNAKILSTCGLP